MGLSNWSLQSQYSKFQYALIQNSCRLVMEDSEKVKLDHQRNKSEIVNLVKEMFKIDKWGDEQFRVELQDLVTKDEKLVKDVIDKIKREKGIE